MTRINIIPPKVLTDQHLIGEYNEIRRPVGLALKRHAKLGKRGFEGLPKNYTLGGGHVLFFYDKLAYLHNRFYEICNEMTNRGFNPQGNFDTSQIFSVGADYLFNDWTPTEDDKRILKARLIEKIQIQNTHKFHRIPIDKDNYIKNILIEENI